MANNFLRKETYTPEEIFKNLPNPADYPKNFNLKKVKVDYDGDLMKMGSQRYYVFRKSLKCSHCERVGLYFAKETHLNKQGEPASPSFHFNLYAIDPDGTEVLMTKDHVLARSKGGANSLKNYVTMCEPCNSYKRSMDEEKAKELAEERQRAGILLKLGEVHG